MNCKPGELAIIIRANGEESKKYIGRIVKCLVAHDNYWWEVEGDIGWFIGVYDGNLKPLRDSDGTDEMLVITGKPKEKIYE